MSCDCDMQRRCIDSRWTGAGRRRRFVCRACGARWSTMETRLGDVPAARPMSEGLSREARVELLTRTLNDREARVLRLYLQGMALGGIAVEMECSRCAVTRLRDRLAERYREMGLKLERKALRRGPRMNLCGRRAA